MLDTKRSLRFLAMNTTRSTAAAASIDVASIGRRSGDCIAYSASLLNTVADESACTVHIDPSFPWLMALSIGITSSPRTSPTIHPSGLLRADMQTRDASVRTAERRVGVRGV